MAKDLLSKTPKDLLGKRKDASVGGSALKEAAIGLTVGGPVTAASGVEKTEDVLPFALGTAGGFLGAQVGHPHLGIGLGTASGEMAKQTIKKIARGGDIKLEDAVIAGGLASLGSKALSAVFKAAGVSMKIIPERARKAFFDKSLQAVNVGRKALSRNFNKALTMLENEFPNRRINMKPVVERLKNQVNDIDDQIIPQLKLAVKRNKKLREAVDDPNRAIGLSLKEAQELKNAVTSATNTVIKKAVKGKTTPSETVVIDILDDINSAISSKFPQMHEVRRIYKLGKANFDMARKLVEPGESVESAIFSKPQGLFGISGTKFMGSTGGKLAFKDITSTTPQGQKVFDMALRAHNVNRLADMAGRIIEIGGGGLLVKKLFGGKARETTDSVGG